MLNCGGAEEELSYYITDRIKRRKHGADKFGRQKSGDALTRPMADSYWTLAVA
jgi:hypothetical protein